MPFSYTGSEDIDITDDQISLNFPIKINNEIVLNPRAYDGAVPEMLSGTDNFAFYAKHNPWRTTNSTILFINESMYISWRLSNSKYV